MKYTLAFDVYGTLIDTQGVLVELRKHLGDEAQAFSNIWRSKQLEYSFRRGLMQRYVDFNHCTKDAFHFASASLNLTFSAETESAILSSYCSLPAYSDVVDGLTQLRDAGHRLFAFSNGTGESVSGLLDNADIGGLFLDIVSANEIQTFKPDPAVYAHLLKRANAAANETWLVSCNPFDIIGAGAFGLRTAWVKRSPSAVFDPWGIDPTKTVNCLAELVKQISAH